MAKEKKRSEGFNAAQRLINEMVANRTVSKNSNKKTGGTSQNKTQTYTSPEEYVTVRLNQLGLNRNNDEVTSEEVSAWLQQGAKTAMEYKRKDSSKYTTDYDSETSSTVKPLLEKADAVWKYLRNHKNEFKNYDELNKQFGAIRNSLTGINAEIDGVNEYYSQWETEEDYNNYVRTSNYEQKHKGKTYGDIQKTIGDLQKKKSEDTQDEIDWLTDYSKTKEVIDTMTKDELKDYVKGIETREAQLNAEKAQLKKANQEVPARYTAEQFKAKTARDARIKKIDEELAGLGNAYYAEDGTAITYDSLYRIKGVEEDIEAIKNNPVLNAAYESILTYEDPLKEDNDIHRMENAMAALSARQDPSIVPNEEYEKDLDYIIKKYRIDITGTDEAIKNEIFNVYNAVGTNSNDIAEAQKRLLADAGYDWEEIKHYRKWQADKEESAKLQESYKIASENYPISSTIGSALFAPARGVDFAIDMYEASKSRDADDDSAYGIANIYDNYAGNMVDTIASEVSENISNDVLEATDSEFLAWLASTGYSGVSSGIQSTLTQAVGNLIAPGFGAFVLGSEAAESQYVEAIKNGSTQSRAAASGVAAGIAEGLFEKYSFDKLVDISYTMDASSFKSFVKSTLSNSFNLNKQGLVESSEELFTSISNAITDNIFNGNHSSYNVSVDKYVRNGMTYDEANKQASIDFGVQLLTDVVGGYAGGVSSSSVKTYVGGAFSAVNNRIEYNNALKQEGKAVLDQGGVDTLKALALDIAGEQHGIKNFASKVALERQANKVSGEVYEGKGLGGRISAAVKNSRNAKAVGRLSDTVRTTISEQNMSEIKADLRKQGMSNAEANKIANEFIAVVENGGEFSEELQNAIEKSVEDGTALGETWANVFGKDSAIVARNNRYNLARSGFETDSKGELTEEGKKTATKKMNDKLGITGTVETDAKEFDVNSDGENFSKKSGNAIESLAFVDTEDGIKIKVSDTETVDARDVSYKDATTAAIFSTIATLGADAKTANEIANMFSNITDENQAVYIASDMALAYKYGRMNYGDSYLTKLDSLTPQDAKIIYNKGREQAILHKENEVAKFKSAVEKAKTEKTNGKKVGNLTLAGNISTDSKSRTSKENANIMVAEIMSKLTGTEIYVGKSSLDQNGNRTWTLPDGTVVTANGLYLPSKIYLDINAGNFGEGILLETLGHELGHHIKMYNPELFAKIADYLMEEFEKNGYDVRGMIQEEIRKIEAREAREKALAKRNGKPFKAKTEQQIEDEAHEEFVCQAFVGMLQDGTVAKSLANLKQQDYSVWKVIMDTIKDLLEKWGLIIKEYEGRELSTKEGQALASMKDVFKKVQEMYIEGLKGANENFDALGTMNDNVFMLQQRHYNEANPVTGMSGRDTLYEYLENTYGTEDANNLISTIDNINNVMDEIKRDHPELNVFSQWQDTEIDIDENGHPIFTTSINNGDYELNQDFSRVCKKRRQLDFVLNLLAEDPNFEASYLTKEDFVAINNAIKEHGFEIACALCFVDSKRFRQAEWADSFANTWNDILSSLMVDGSNPTPFNFATKSANIADENINLDLSKPITLRKWSNGKVSETRKYDNIEHMLSKVEKNGKLVYVEGNSNIRTIATLIRDNPQLRHTFRGADIISSSGFDSIQKLAPEVRSILDGWGGSSVPKPSSSDASYDNSVLNIKGYNKKAAYAMGGVRMNSFSDFMAHMFFDYCEAFADLSAKQLPMQSYTKELVFARLFGKLGGKINMSGIAAVRKNTLPLTESKKDGITKDQAEKNKEIEKRFAGLDISRLMEHLQKDVSDITTEDLEQNLDLCEYLWADESIDMIKATLLQSGILYDKLSESKQAECYELLKDGKFDKAFKVAGKNNVDTDYAANIGTIVVGVSDAHIRKLLRDNTIRMVIPYHKSGLNPLIANLLKISVYDDYTDFQSTGVVLKGAKKRVNLSSKEIKDSLGLVDFNFYDYFGKTIDGVTYDGSAVADKYLDWCENGVYDAEVGDYVYYTTKDKGYILAKDLHKKLKVVPKFEQFSNELNYYKVLEDFDCYNTITGEHSPQGAVKFLEKGLPEDYKKILTDALIEEQQVQDDFRDHLDNKGLKEEIMGIVSKRGYNATEGVGIAKKVSKAEYKEQARELQRKDPTKLKEEELTTLLGYTKDKMLADDTYIPMRVNTPKILIAFAKEFGYELENHPLAMQVYKARQALSNEENWDGSYKDKPHDLSSEEIIGIIKAMDNPSHLIFQTENERFAEIVKFEKEGIKEKAYAVVDFSDVNKNPDLMNGYKGGKYNILVTVYPSEDAADLKSYLSNKNHKVLTGEQMKKKGLSQGSYGGNTPSLLNDSPFFEDSIPQTFLKSQEQDAAYIDAEYQRYVESWNKESAQRMVDEKAKNMGAVLDENGNPLKLYRGTMGGQTVFAKETTLNGKIYTIDNIDVASKYGDKSGKATEIAHQIKGEKSTYALYGFPKKMLTIDAQYGVWSDLVIPNELLKYADGRYKATNGEIAEWAELEGYDSLRINNVRDGSFDVGNEIIFFDENLVKSADPVTYDDNGNVIPLSERFNENDNDIRYSDRDIKPITKAEYKELESHFGTTGNFKVAGYLLTNGKMLDFSGKHWGDTKSRMRQVDHRDVQEVLDDRDNGFGAMVDMIGNGNIRLMPETGGICLAVYPNEKQRRVLSQYINYMLNTEGQIIIDYDAVGGDTVYSKEYGRTATSKQILNDIRNYFNGGRQSELMQFHTMYQERDPSTSNRSILASALESAAQNDIERNKLAEYKKKISLIESEEQKLSTIQKQLFTKDAVEPAKRKELQFEAKQISNRINTYDRQLLNLEATTALKNVLNREKALAMKRQKQKDAEYLKQYKEKVQNDKKALVSKYQESRKKAVESRTKTAMRHKIKNVVSELNRMLLKGSKERNVKLDLQSAVASALDAINMDTIGAEERIAKLEQDLLKAKTPEKIQEISRKIDNVRGQGDRMSSKLNALKRAYEKIKANDDNLPNYFTEEASLIIGRIEATAEKVGDTPLRYMSLAQLEAVHDLYNLVLTTVRNANKVFVQGKLEDLQHNASATMEELSSIRTLPEERADFGWLRSFSWNEMIPVYAFRRIGSKTFEKFFWEAIRGQNVVAQDLSEANDFAKDTREKYGYKKWDLDKVHEFKLADGRTFRVTLRHMMSIYAYSKRNQALDHMTKGGFFFNDKSTFRKKGGIIKLIKSNEVGYSIDLNTLEAIVNEMTPEQRKYVDDMQTYLTQMGDKGNEVSRVLWGIDIFKEKVYFPLKSVKDFIYQTNQTAQESSLKNDGMTKETKPGASNPIVLEAFDDVWASHVNRMSQYHGLVIPIENLNKIHNYGTWANTESMSVSTMLRARFGEAVNDYLNNFIKDLNGATSVSGASNPFFSFVGKFKKTAVAASASVVVQQPTAIARAAAVMDMKYFIGLPKAKSLSAQWSELQKYAPIAIIKEIGGFDAGAGRQATEWLNSDTRRGIDKIEGKIDDITMKGAAIGDQLGWCTIWEAVKREIKSTTDLKVGSEEFLKKAGERFTEVIVLTQVYDSTLSRSGFMRSKHDSVKMLTAFMGEPTVSINMMADATIQAKRGTITKRKAGRIIGAVYTSIILASIASSLIYGLRDDDEDESYLEKFAEALGGKLLDEINPFNMLPGIRDIISIFDGWDIERTDMAIFKDIKDAFDGLSSDNKSAWRKVEDFTGAIASIFGVPLKNVLRSARETYNAISNIFDDVTPSNVDDAFVRGVTGEKKDKSKSLYDAIINGDDARLEIYRKEYTDDKAYEQAVRKALRDNDPRIKVAAEARIGGDIAEYTRIVKEIKAEGFFSQDTIVASVNAEINAINKGESSSSENSATENKESSIYTMDDYFASIVGGDQATAYVVKEDIIKTDVANGKDRDEAEDNFNSRFASHVREQYEDGYISDYEAEKMLVNYGGKTEQDAASKVQYWSFKQEYPDYDDLSEEAVDKYYNDVESHGISIHVYYDYSKQRSKCKGTDKNGDGKTDSGSVKAEVLRVIDSLPITKAQKDALYYLNGWSARTIYEAPWR